MEAEDDPSSDISSIKPVSSLRSHFEKIGATPRSSRENSPGSKGSRGVPESALVPTRTSTDIQRREKGPESQGDLRQAIPKPIPAPCADLPRLNPALTKPKPPLKPLHSTSVKSSTPVSQRQNSISILSTPSEDRELQGSYFQGALPASSRLNLSDKSQTLNKPSSRDQSPRSPFLHPSEINDPEELSTKHFKELDSLPTKTKTVPPPINRTDKPKAPIISTSRIHPDDKPSPAQSFKTSNTDEKSSPFTTPPNSAESPQTDAARLPPTIPPPRSKIASAAPQGPPNVPTSTTRRPAPPPPAPRQSRGVVRQNPESDASTSAVVDDEEDRPSLPPRRDMSGPVVLAEQRNPLARRNDLNMSTPGGKLVSATTSQFLSPPKRKSALASSNGRADNISSKAQTSQPAAKEINLYEGDSSDSEGDPTSSAPFSVGEPSQNSGFPDISQANRRPPTFHAKIQQIECGQDVRGGFAICGEHICTAGHSLKVWSLKSGDLIFHIGFEGESLKATAVAFKSADSIGSEGFLIWLGFNNGDLSELDVSSRSTKYTKANAHNKRDVLRIFRVGKSMWTLDEKKVAVWSSQDDGPPDLRETPDTFSIPQGHTFSMPANYQLWIGCTVRQETFLSVFAPESRSTSEVFQKSLASLKVGSVTSGTLLGAHPDKVFLGHLSGDVSVHSQTDYSCISVVRVATHKISSLAGIGEFLWAGFPSGVISIYDTRREPWVLRKDWAAHDHVLRLQTDRISPWKMGRPQIISLGNEGTARLWDGTIEDDWLETTLKSRDADYCSFKEIEATVVTWNAGASKPEHLRYNERDCNFIRDIFAKRAAPDILVFGFQELVDLERTSTAARSFFHSSKKKELSEQDHMRHQYREWRDYLERAVNEHTVDGESYVLYHNANLIGLFSCVFIKYSMEKRVKYLDSSEVKRGMGGLAGNKGALVCRFLVDDSSICFLNCHLAAGQNQTKQRHSDVSAILASSGLAAERNLFNRIDRFTGGGDGRMALDHEICILNGDLNYRVNSMTRDGAVKAANSLDLPKLLERDQLLWDRRRDPEFRLRAFNEVPITFPPTYKYDVGTDTYDTSSKARVPSWCDRILYRGLGRIKQIDYCRHEVRVSDHRPVSASFRIRVKKVSAEKRDSTWERCTKDFEAQRAQVMKQCKMDFLRNEGGLDLSEAKRLLEK